MDTDTTSVWKRKYHPCYTKYSCDSVKSSQVVSSPTTAAPKLLQLQRPNSMSGGDGSTSKENGLVSPRRSFDSSSGSIRSDSSSIHPLKYTWVCYCFENRTDCCRHFGVCIVNLGKVQEQLVIIPQQTRK